MTRDDPRVYMHMHMCMRMSLQVTRECENIVAVQTLTVAIDGISNFSFVIHVRATNKERSARAAA